MVWCLSSPSSRCLAPRTLLGPLLAGRAQCAAATFPRCRRPARHAFQGSLHCRADFLAPLPLSVWLLCASSREWISIRILRRTETCPLTSPSLHHPSVFPSASHLRPFISLQASTINHRNAASRRASRPGVVRAAKMST